MDTKYLKLWAATLLAAALCGKGHTQILIGQTAGFTGPVAAGVKENTDGARLWLDAVNARGGIAGQQLELVSLDDKFDPKLAAENARKLADRGAIALFLTRGTPPTEAVLPVLEASRMLLMEFHGTPSSVKEQAELVQELASGHGGNAFEWASTPEERTRLWTARHNAYFAAIQSRPGCRAISTDTCVPISRLADCLLESVAEVDASGIPYFLVGHVGDGNFHFGYLLDPNIPEERVKAEELNHSLVSRALALEGTCTGEHGVGLHKMGFLVQEHGEDALDLMRAIKAALDPNQILNPGKIFSAAR